MAATFGIDFGTTNSVATVIGLDPNTGEEAPLVMTNQEDFRPHPSVVWYPGVEPICGRNAKKQLNELGLGVYGDIVRSPKMYLGSTAGIHLGGQTRSAADVVADFFCFLREDAIARGIEGNEFTHAVVTIPVSMPGHARAELREAALRAGVHIHQFIHEPLAALYGHLRAADNFQARLSQLERRLMLVFDWGGGTLDLTLVQLDRGVLTQVINEGDPTVGGDEFDRRLVNLVKDRHGLRFPQADWSRMQFSAEARLIEQCEDAKIRLSERNSATILVPDLLSSDGPEKDLEVTVTRAELEDVAGDLVRKGLNAVDRLLSKCGLPRDAVEFCLATGGMVAMPIVREGLEALFGFSRLQLAKNSATVISEGAAWAAKDRIRLCLAKPFEVLVAHDSYVEIFPAGTPLPTEGEPIQNDLLLYCTDPRDGFAKIEFARPQWPGRHSRVEARIPYCHLTLPVNHHTDPLMERIDCRVVIDDNLVANPKAKATARGETRETEIHDLEFGIRVATTDSPDADDETAERSQRDHLAARQLSEVGAVRVRSNVTSHSYANNLIPGDFYKTWPLQVTLTQRQRDERGLYLPCTLCNKSDFEIREEGCDRCAQRGLALSCVEAEEMRKKRKQDRARRSSAA